MDDLPQRKQLRLKDYDYSHVGADDPVRPLQMHANEIGAIVCEC